MQKRSNSMILLGALSTLALLVISILIMKITIIDPQIHGYYEVCRILSYTVCDRSTQIKSYLLQLPDIVLIGNTSQPQDCKVVAAPKGSYTLCFYDGTLSLRGPGFPVFGVWMFTVTSIITMIVGFATVFCYCLPFRGLREFRDRENDNASLLEENDDAL